VGSSPTGGTADTDYATSESTIAVPSVNTLIYSPAASENSMARSTNAGATWSLTQPAVEQPTAFWNTVDPDMIAVGGRLHKAGVPSISYIAGPNYLVDLAPGDHLDKLDTNRFAMQVRWLADITQRLDKLPKALLQTGDTTVWANDGGSLTAIP
jgi:hypothetical protein